MAGMARLAMSRPDFPKMSPMNRIRTSVGPYRNAMLPAAPFFNPRHRDAQLARMKRGLCACHVERAGQPHGTRKPSEHAFRHMERGIAMMLAAGRLFHAADEQGIASDHDLHGVRAHADQIQQHLHAIGCLHDVERNATLGRMGTCVSARELFKQTPQVVVDFASIEKDASHESILSLSASLLASRFLFCAARSSLLTLRVSVPGLATQNPAPEQPVVSERQLII